MAQTLDDNVEFEHVHKVYSQIASHFSDTRFKPWPKIAQFLNNLPVSSLVADIGCGNGKYLGVNPSTYCLGSDICPELVSIASERGHEVAVCDCLQLPYCTCAFDAVICIAVIHHLSTEERRLSALKEMARVLRSGGQMLVYVWAMEQDKRKFSAQDVMVPWHLQPKYTKGEAQTIKCTSPNSQKIRERKRLKKERKKRQKTVSLQTFLTEGTEQTSVEEETSDNEGLLGELATLDLSEEDFNHPKVEDSSTAQLESCVPCLVDSTETNCRATDCGPDKDAVVAGGQSSESVANKEQLQEIGYQTFQRYYHVFRQGELLELFSKLDDVKITEEFFDHENWCVIGEKV